MNTRDFDLLCIMADTIYTDVLNRPVSFTIYSWMDDIGQVFTSSESASVHDRIEDDQSFVLHINVDTEHVTTLIYRDGELNFQEVDSSFYLDDIERAKSRLKYNYIMALMELEGIKV